MEEYISRKAAMQGATDAYLYNLDKQQQRQIAAGIASIPAADVVEVVRCKDCKHWHYNPKTREWEYDEIKEAETHE